MELKLDKTTKILLGVIALGLFLNASNVFIDKAYAKDKIQKVQICEYHYLTMKDVCNSITRDGALRVNEF
ncbi:hypothetical protein OAS34_00575 [Methylophilaceae bacterium]|nr:hypothetical protein [Methylophilaceae bacterium]